MPRYLRTACPRCCRGPTARLLVDPGCAGTTQDVQNANCRPSELMGLPTGAHQ